MSDEKYDGGIDGRSDHRCDHRDNGKGGHTIVHTIVHSIVHRHNQRVCGGCTSNSSYTTHIYVWMGKLEVILSMEGLYLHLKMIL